MSRFVSVALQGREAAYGCKDGLRGGGVEAPRSKGCLFFLAPLPSPEDLTHA